MTSIIIADISDADITSLIAEATKEVNRKINVRVNRERVLHIDNTRKNKIDNSNTTYYIRNWKGKYLADMDNDGDVDTSDIIVNLVDNDGTETTATVSSITADEGKFVLSSAPSDTKRMYVTYEWCFRDPSTPDGDIALATTLLTTAYAYAKINIGRAPQKSFGNIKIFRDMNSFEHYYKRFLNVINDINEKQIGIIGSVYTDEHYAGENPSVEGYHQSIFQHGDHIHGAD